jgi:FkbM family methyltransferase
MTNDMKMNVTESDVRMAYELLLGRPAESEKAVRDHLVFDSLAALGKAIMRSQEFQGKLLQSTFANSSKWVAVDVLDRFTQWVDLHDRFVSYGCLNNDWEPSETNYFISNLSAGDTVLDIGANIGWFTLVAAKYGGANARIHSFEPRPETARMLKRTVSDNNLRQQVTVWEYALSDKWGKCKLVWEKGTDNPGGSFLASSAMSDDQNVESVEITTAVLDELLPDIAPDIIKIDVEGGEPRALQGAKNAILRKRPTIVSELYPAQLAMVSGVTPQQYIGQLAQCGYACYLLEDGRPTRRLSDYPSDIGGDLVSVVFECIGPMAK